MKIHSLAKLLILPVVLGAIGIIYYGETTGRYYFTVWVIVPGILLAILLVFMPQIDYWWHTKYPVPLDQPIIKWLQLYHPFYNTLEGSEKLKFENRLSLYIEAREFKTVGSELTEVPDDIKGIVGSIAIMMTFQEEDFLIGDYDRIYLYKHPFPSPRMQFLHSVEIDHEDGLVIFSVEHLLPGMTNAANFFNIGYYAFADIYLTDRGKKIASIEPTWEQIEALEILSKDHIVTIVGYENLNLNAVLISLFLSSPAKFKESNTLLFEEIKNILKPKSALIS